MAETIKRYRNNRCLLHEEPDGPYVLYDDHAAALAAKEGEIAKLTKALGREVKAHAETVDNREAAIADAYRRGQESMRGDAMRKAREHCCGTHPAAHAMCGCSDVIGDDIERLTLRPEGG